MALLMARKSQFASRKPPPLTRQEYERRVEAALDAEVRALVAAGEIKPYTRCDFFDDQFEKLRESFRAEEEARKAEFGNVYPLVYGSHKPKPETVSKKSQPEIEPAAHGTNGETEPDNWPEVPKVRRTAKLKP